jgi:ribosomal protein S18 acetylase RimI-like enzyme
MIIRTLQSEDRESIIALVKATKNFNDEEVAIAKELIDICIEQPEQKDYYTYVAEVASGGRLQVAGFLLLGPTPATSGTYDMYWIAVHPDFQGRGIAQALDAYAEEFVRGRGGYWLLAETSGQDGYSRTRAFYEKQGYSILARIPDYYKPSDDLIIYGKRLGE